jgi:predicted nucleic acid-binding protein
MSQLTHRPVVSVITAAELFAGVREGAERKEIEQFLHCTVLIDVDEQIAVQAGLMLRQYRKSHGVGLADALIAAPAEAEHARMVTLNTKHFPMLKDVLVPYQKA